MNRRQYAALDIVPLAMLGGRCTETTGSGSVCTRWAQWTDRNHPDHRPLCTQHAHRTARNRVREPHRADALAAASAPVTYTVVVTGETAQVHRDGTPADTLTVARDGVFYGLDQLISAP